MKAIGLDIGTSKICGVLIDADSGELLATRSRVNDATLSPDIPGAACQDPSRILALCNVLLEELTAISADIISIGFTGQMHGILYLDIWGKPVSPLYTWQDQRGNRPFRDGETYASTLSRVTNHKMATGYGLTTHYCLLQECLVPAGAATFCTIHDYVAMVLANRKAPLVHVSDAASFGLYEATAEAFCFEALRLAGIDPAVMPEVTAANSVLGRTSSGISVAVAIGDNQASYFGSVDNHDSILVNVGTGSQVSIEVSSDESSCDVQIRPYIGEGFIAVGSPLCGGFSYALLKQFFEETGRMFGAVTNDTYKKMDSLASAIYPSVHPLCADTRFRGTRDNPAIRGSFTGLSPENFHPGELCLAVLQGMVSELFSLYQKMPKSVQAKLFLVGSGNGIRQSPLLQRIFADTFSLPLRIPRYQEEAAIGSALFSLLAVGYCQTVSEIQKKIHYQ